jgi:hypothetical protein
MPIILSARPVAVAILVTEIEEVLVARMASFAGHAYPVVQMMFSLVLHSL